VVRPRSARPGWQSAAAAASGPTQPAQHPACRALGRRCPVRGRAPAKDASIRRRARGCAASTSPAP